MDADDRSSVTSPRCAHRPRHIEDGRDVLVGMYGGTKPTTGTTTAIHVRHLTKTYPGGVEAVRGLDFDVASGEVFGLLGPNGAGKSTTVGMLTTTIVPTSGVARLGGYDVATEPLAARRISAVVFQEPVVDRALSGRR